MIEIPKKLSPGEVISVSRALRRKNKGRIKGSLKEQGAELGLLLIELDRRGFDADVVVRKKRGRPSHLSGFLSKQDELL